MVVRRVYPLVKERACIGSRDLPALLDLLGRARPAAWLVDYPSFADFTELLENPKTCRNTHMWFVRGQLASYALLDVTFQNLWFEADPAETNHVSLQSLLDWGVSQAQRLGMEFVDTACREEDRPRVDFLEQSGFTRMHVETLRLERSLDGSISEPELPPGYSLRAAPGEEEDAAWVSLHQAAYATQHLNSEDRRAMRKASDYDPALDLLAIAPDGQLAGYLVCTIHPEENRMTGRRIGYSDPLAVHPAHQGRGLAQALLNYGLRLLKERGIQVAAAGTTSENQPARAAFAAAGFHVVSTRAWFTLELNQ